MLTISAQHGILISVVLQYEVYSRIYEDVEITVMKHYIEFSASILCRLHGVEDRVVLVAGDRLWSLETRPEFVGLSEPRSQIIFCFIKCI